MWRQHAGNLYKVKGKVDTDSVRDCWLAVIFLVVSRDDCLLHEKTRMSNPSFYAAALNLCLSVAGASLGPAMVDHDAGTGLTSVATPCGLRPQECVLEVPNGARVEETANGRAVVVTDAETGKELFRHQTPELCHLPQYAGSAGLGSSKAAAAVTASQAGAQPKCDEPPCTCDTLPCNDWIDNAGFLLDNEAEGPFIGGFSSTYTVPQTPADAMNQVLFYFIGAENTNGTARLGPDRAILQPVLTFDPSPGGYCQYGNESNWCMSSWYCCPANLTTHSTYLQNIQPGDQYVGSFNLTSPTEFQVLSQSVATGASSTLVAPRQNRDFNWADVTLECYYVKECSGMAQGLMSFNDLLLWDTKYQDIEPDWSFTPSKPCNGTIQEFWDTTITIQHGQ